MLWRRRRRGRSTLVVYVRAGCHLCAEALKAVRALQAESAVDVVLRDVDEDPTLHDRYSERVPVVTLNGREVASLHVDGERLRRALDAAGHSAVFEHPRTSA